MKDFPLAEGVYQNGPVFFSVQPEVGEDKFGSFTYYLPINEEVKLSSNDNFTYLEHFELEDALVLRQADQETDFQTAYEKLKGYAEKENIPLEDTFYVVMLEVYDDYIIDLYVPKRIEVTSGDR